MGKAKKMARGEKFQFVGYYNCLDFVNTEFTEQRGRRIDSLRSFPDLIDWLGESRLLNRAQLQDASNRQANDDESTDQHKDRGQSAFAGETGFAHFGTEPSRSASGSLLRLQL